VNRRHFLQSAGAVSACLAFPKPESLQGAISDSWRTFEVKTRVEMSKVSTGPTRVWLPAGIIRETPFQKTLSNEFSVDGGTAQV